MHYRFRYPELFDGVERPDFHKLSGNLVLYGAGFQGLLAAHLLKKQNVRVLCFADRDIRKQGTLYYGIPVVPPEEMKEKYPDATVMATPYGLSSVIEYLKEQLHYLNIITPFSLFLEFDSGEFDKLPNLPAWYHPETLDYNIEMFLMKCVGVQTKHQIVSVGVSVSEKCNLRCKNCISLMPCYEKPKDFGYEDVLDSIMKVIKGRIVHRVLLEGGEPFLWKPLSRLITELSKQKEIMNIMPISNGTVMPKEDLLEALKNEKVIVRCSDYGTYSKVDELKELLESNGINYKIQLQTWYQLSALSVKEKTGEELENVVKSCCKLQLNAALYIKNRKLFKCPLQANLHDLGIFGSKEHEYVDLCCQDDIKLQQRITDYFTKPMVPIICAHCDGRGFTGIEVPPAEQLKKGEKLQVHFE